MNDPFKELLDKEIGREPIRQKSDVEEQLSSGFVEANNSPFDRLRSSLRRFFPHCPDVFCGNNGDNDKKD